MQNHSEIVSFLWSVADLIRDTFKRGKYQDVILPFTVLRRIDCVLAPTKQRVLERNAELKGKGLENRHEQLCKAAGYAFYNTSRYDFQRLKEDPAAAAANLRNYIKGFSPNMGEVLERYDFDNTITKLDEAGLLFKVLEKFTSDRADLSPAAIDNHAMGTVFEELIRKFNEMLDENPGEHFTPRDVVNLMGRLLIAPDHEALKVPGRVVTIADPCCGTGGMLTLLKERITALNPKADVFMFGQEVNPETFAICKSDLLMSSKTGKEAEHIAFGSTLERDAHDGKAYDYQLANPPYGKDWNRDKEAVEAEHEKGDRGRFPAGLPRISDGQMLFLQCMIARMAEAKHAGAKKGLGGGRVAIIMNGSPLFTGDAGSGESEIRRWIIENDWLEAIIALPEQLFYNTGIATYIWLVSNRKPEARRRRVQLIDATSLWTPMRKSLGDKRREIAEKFHAAVERVYLDMADGDFVVSFAEDGSLALRPPPPPPRPEDRLPPEEEEKQAKPPMVRSKVFGNSAFGYRKITVERPLRLNFAATSERIDRLHGERGFATLAASKKKGKEAEKEIAEGMELQRRIVAMLGAMGPDLFRDRERFSTILNSAAADHDLKLRAPVWKAILSALSERDETAEICRDADGKPEPDPELRDTESVPLDEPDGVEAYFEREVLPHVPDAWINTVKRDHKDGEVGEVGYEINFNRCFYVYVPPRPLAKIEAELKALEGEIVAMLGEVMA